MHATRALLIAASLAPFAAACTSGEDVVAIGGARSDTLIHGVGSRLCVPGTYRGCIRNDADAAQIFAWANIAFALVQTGKTGEFAALSNGAEVRGRTNTDAHFDAALSSDPKEPGCRGGQIKVDMSDGHYFLSGTGSVGFQGTILGQYFPPDDNHPERGTGGDFEGTWSAQATIPALRFTGSWSADWVSADEDAGASLADAGVNQAECPSPH
jgi:hypothetical protein